MDKIKIFAQAYTIPKNGGVFWYDVLSTYKDISWNDVEFNITGASVAERDTTNEKNNNIRKSIRQQEKSIVKFLDSFRAKQ